MLTGSKTYMVVAAMILYAILGLVLGYQEAPEAMKLVLEALAVAGLRIGVAKAEILKPRRNRPLP
ncbi:hypothetical protein LCGC14_1289740 [marine sediment metagenome]|uniref:Uncharacterized protein n=1 Tax=marine sediment metagenome TaxID=412755 RepID=A0A0F9NVR8_9ZZZZ